MKTRGPKSYKLSTALGFSLVEAIVYVALGSMALTTAFSVLKISSEMSKSANSFVKISDIRSTLLNNLKSDTAFTNSISAPANAGVFACLNNKTDCHGQGGAFNIYDAQGNQVSRVSTPGSSEGFNKDGVPCTGFDLASGNDSCPYRFVATWAPGCPSAGSCLNPVVQIKVTLDVAPKDTSQIGNMNVSSFEIFYVKSNFSATLSDTCTKMGGILNPDQSCTLPFYSGPCPRGDYLVGFDNNNNKICQHLKGVDCPRGQVLLGIDNTGIAHCGPGCTDPVGTSSGSIW